MLFVGYPKLTQAERLAPLPPLAAGCVEPAVALKATGRSEAPLSLRLTSIAGEPRYLLGYRDANLAVDARDGSLRPQGPLQALASARQFSGAEAHYVDEVNEDLWSHSRALDADRPLHKVRVDDAARSLLYVSSRTGEVVRDASRAERAWNYLGAWLHWLYPLRGGVLDGIWANIVIYLSLAATAMAVLGAVVGLLRWRFSRPYRSGSRSPYPAGFARWHHLTGLGFGLLLIAWIFSGLMSMRPWHLTEGRSPLAARDFQGGELQAGAFKVGVDEALQRFREAGLEPAELQWRMLGGVAYLGALDARGDSRVLPLAETGPALAQLPVAPWKPPRPGPRRKPPGWRPTTPITTRAAKPACTAASRSACRCCAWPSTTPATAGCISTPQRRSAGCAGRQPPRRSLAVQPAAQLGLAAAAGTPVAAGGADHRLQPRRPRHQRQRRGDRLATVAAQAPGAAPTSGFRGSCASIDADDNGTVEGSGAQPLPQPPEHPQQAAHLLPFARLAGASAWRARACCGCARQAWAWSAAALRPFSNSPRRIGLGR